MFKRDLRQGQIDNGGGFGYDYSGSDFAWRERYEEAAWESSKGDAIQEMAVEKRPDQHKTSFDEHIAQIKHGRVHGQTVTYCVIKTTKLYGFMHKTTT